MLRYLRKIKGQSTLEYAILVVIIIGALLAIQVYVKRGMQARLRQSTDQISGEEQYSPGNTKVTKTTKTHSKTQDTFSGGVSTSTIAAGDETINVDMDQSIIDKDTENWQ